MYQIFFEFVRAPNAKRHAAEGTGLGLAIVREVIRAHGGEIILLGRDGRGSTFSVHLDLRHEPEEVRHLLPGGNDSGYRPDTPESGANLE